MSTEEKKSLEPIHAAGPGEPETRPEREKSSLDKEKLGVVIEGIPVVGKIFKFFKAIFAFGGYRGIICLGIGFGLASLLIYLGLMPDFLIAEKYRHPPVTEVRTKPTDIRVHLAEPVEWLKPHVRWLEKEGDDLTGKNVIKGYMANAFESAELSPTTEFNWMLEATPGFEINGFGFRLHNSGSSKFFEQLNAIKKAPKLLIVEVPKCEKGDRLVAILRVSWKQDLESAGILSTFHSSAK
jgi:hypothetical protein